MKETEEIRCLNKNGKVRFISEHLAKNKEYMLQMGLTAEDPKLEKNHFETVKEKAVNETKVVLEKQEEVIQDEFSEVPEIEEKKPKKK